MSNQRTSPYYNPLVIISGLVGVSAFGGGIYGMSGAKGIPLELLEGSMFPNYFIPSLILFMIVGGFSLLSTIMILKGNKNARRITILTGVIILIWIVFQLNIIGYESWLQPFIAIAGISILLLSGKLPDSKQSNSSQRNMSAFN
jgi:CBS domain containing-hemolysin-like protein